MDTERKTTILDLNFDVLDIIFSNFYWHKDKLSLAKAHPHFSAAFVYHSGNRYNEISCEVRNPDLPFILEWFGSKVISLRDISDKHIMYPQVDQTNQILNLAANYCPNLEVIQLLISSENVKMAEDTLVKLKKLNYIFLTSIRHEHRELINAQNIFNILKHLPNLRRIGLNYWTDLAPMNNLENLEDLELKITQVGDINVLCKVWKNLKVLRTYATSEVLNLLSKHCESLEYLRLRSYEDYDKSMIAYFPKLKRLKIFSSDDYNDDVAYLRNLHGKYNNQLETLEFPKDCIETAKTARRISKLKAVKTLCCQSMGSRCIRYIARMPLEKLMMHELKENDLLILLSECKTLKWIHLDRLNLGEKSLVTLLDILKSNGFQPENPFVLRLKKREVPASIQNKLPSCSYKKLLDVQETSFSLFFRYRD